MTFDQIKVSIYSLVACRYVDSRYHRVDWYAKFVNHSDNQGTEKQFTKSPNRKDQ